MLTDPLPIFCSTNKRLKQLFFYSKILNFLHSLIHIVVDPLSYLRAWYLSRKISWRPIIRKRALGLINEEPWRSISIRVIPISFFREWRVVTGGRGWDRSVEQAETGLDACGLVSNQFHADRSALQARPHCLPSIRPADRATYAPIYARTEASPRKSLSSRGEAEPISTRFPSISTSLSASSYPCFFESSFDPSLLPRNFSASSYPCFFESSFDPSLLPRNFSMPLLVIWKGQRERGEATMMDSGYGNYVGEVKASWLSSLEALVFGRVEERNKVYEIKKFRREIG